MAIEVWLTKVLVLTALFIITFLFSMIPVKFMSIARHTVDNTKQHRYQVAISFGSCYAAGVFLATCLLDLFPEVEEKIQEAFDQYEIVSTFPFAEFVMVFGLFVILFVEQLVLYIKEHRENGNDEEHKPLLPESRNASRRSSMGSFRDMQRSLSVGISDQPIIDHIDHDRRSRASSLDFDKASTEVDSNSAVVFSEEKHPSHHQGHSQASHHQEHSQASHHHGHGHSHDIEFSTHQDLSSHSVIRSILLLLALSFHSVFEGLAVGLQPTTNDVVQIFAALVLHKSILAFSLGINLVQSRLSFWATIRSNLLFAVTAPIGIGIGIFVLDMANTRSANLTSGLLQGIACGTFLYITFFEVLPHEFNSSDHRLLKVLFLILGFSTITVVMLLTPEHHDVSPHHVGN